MQRLLYEENAYRTLTRLYTGGRFPHALLIEGAPGSGKRTLAQFAAALLLCRSDRGRPCGTCLSCKKLESKNHPDLVVLDGDEKKAYAIDNVRALRQEVWRAPNESVCRVFLLTQAQNMDPRSQNALLKLIEEPPAHAYFILTVSVRGALLDTIVSRTVQLRMEELEEAKRQEALAALCPEKDAGERKNAALAFETVGQALAALSDEKAKTRLSFASSFLDAAVSGDRYRLFRLLSAFDSDREGLLAALPLARRLAIARLTQGKGDFSALQCRRIVDIIEKAEERARQNVGIPLLCAVMADRLSDAVSG